MTPSNFITCSPPLYENMMLSYDRRNMHLARCMIHCVCWILQHENSTIWIDTLCYMRNFGEYETAVFFMTKWLYFAYKSYCCQTIKEHICWLALGGGKHLGKQLIMAAHRPFLTCKAIIGSCSFSVRGDHGMLMWSSSSNATASRVEAFNRHILPETILIKAILIVWLHQFLKNERFIF